MTAAAWIKRYGHPPAETAEFVCQPHWSAVPAIMRRAYSRVKRRERRFGCDLPAGYRLWRRIKRETGALPSLRGTEEVCEMLGAHPGT